MAITNGNGNKIINASALNSILTAQKNWLDTEFGKKQDTLKVGDGIAISSDNTISVTLDTTPFVVVTSLPTNDNDNKGKIHLLLQTDPKSKDTTNNKYTEYLYVNSTWEKLGEVSLSDVDLSEYAKKTEAIKEIKYDGDTGVLSYVFAGGATGTAGIGVAGSTYGVIKTGFAQTGTSYAVQLNASGQAFVNVPWKDTVFTLTNGDGTKVGEDTTSVNINLADNSGLTLASKKLSVDKTVIAEISYVVSYVTDAVKDKYSKTEVDKAIDDVLKAAGYTTNTGTVTKVSLTYTGGLTGSVDNDTTTPAISIGVDDKHVIPTETQVEAWTKKQDAITDLDTIKSNAANGQTAYSWGDHKLGNYAKSADLTNLVNSISGNNTATISYTTYGGGSGSVTVNNVAQADNATKFSDKELKDFILNNSYATKDVAGIVKPGTDFTINPADGSLSVNFPAGFVLEAATSGKLGGIMLGYTATNGVKSYPVELTSDSKAYVSVPWVDTNTEYTNGDGIKFEEDNEIAVNYGVGLTTSSSQLVVDVVGDTEIKELKDIFA